MAAHRTLVEVKEEEEGETETQREHEFKETVDRKQAKQETKKKIE